MDDPHRHPDWSPPATLEERLKHFLVPPRLYMRYRAGKELRKGERELHLLPALVDPSRTAVDAGANKGVWSHLLAARARAVHAFEPNPKLFPILRRGAAANVTCHPLALSDRAGTARLNVPMGHGGYSNQRGTLRDLGGDQAHASVEIATARLDDLDLGDIGFMKIDVEGHELTVLDGARQTLARCRPNLIIEIEEKHTGRPIEDQVAQVEALGYTCLVYHRGSLKLFATLDPAAIHRRPAAAEDYIFNFVFLPAP
ncbi:MAG: FkbM family methyltransferase [Hyphomicrobiales bacterium]|nr:FkbM family methyltransferase [Hyphomicrobiales bacterium]